MRRLRAAGRCRRHDPTAQLPFHALVGEHRDLVCGMNLSMAEGIVDGTNATTYEPVLDPQPGWCCVTYRPVPG
jgi:hypothetical protein